MSLTNEFRNILLYSNEPVADLETRFIKRAVRAGMKGGDEAYYEVLDSLKEAMSDPFKHVRKPNTFNHLKLRGGLQWRR